MQSLTHNTAEPVKTISSIEFPDHQTDVSSGWVEQLPVISK
jgi:hypothetical protein